MKAIEFKKLLRENEELSKQYEEIISKLTAEKMWAVTVENNCYSPFL